MIEDVKYLRVSVRGLCASGLGANDGAKEEEGEEEKGGVEGEEGEPENEITTVRT